MRSFAALAAMALLATPIQAADLGGKDLPDLEERIAELEATVVRKGNKKVSVSLYGQISKSLLYIEADDEEDIWVSENSAAESFLGVSGIAVITPGLRAGFVVELGVGGYEYGVSLPDAETNELYLRQANIYLEREWGQGVSSRVVIGHLSQATDSIAEITTVNTAVVARMGSLRPLNGPELGEVLDLYDGTRVDGIRGDMAFSNGSTSVFTVSASWSSGGYVPTGDDSDIWDVALRYRGEAAGFAFAAGVGYRNGTAIPTIGDVPQLDVYSGSASVKHLATGLFVNAMYGVAELDGASDDVKTWHAQAGLERKFLTSLGATTLFAEYAEVDEDKIITITGVGIVQAFDPAALDLFFNVRHLEFDLGGDEDAYVAQGGARIKF
jgi:hypothetical protein